MSVGSSAAHARPAVRRVPALLTVAALVVLLVAALGARGIITAPAAGGSVIQGAEAPGGLAGPAGPATTTNSTGTPAAPQGVAGATADLPATPLPSSTPASSSPATALASPAPGADGASTTVGSDGTTDTAGAATVADGTVSRSAFVAALGIFFDALAEPAQDSGTPPPLDKSMIPRVTPGPDSTALPADSGSGKRIVYAITSQRVWLVEADGKVSRTYRVSGRLDRPPAGTYHVYSKSRTAVSYDYKETMEYMVRFAHGNTAAIGFHDIPRLKSGEEVQTVDQLGQPLSAGCVRQADPDAVALWNWAPVGTTVVVVP